MSKGFDRDILRANREKLDSNSKRLNRLEVEMFAAGVAHEFNNILGAAMGHAEFALESQDPKEMKEALEAVMQACERSREITWALKGLAQPREERIEKFKFAELFELSKKWMQTNISNSKEIKFKAQDLEKSTGELSGEGDLDQLKEILINLFKNASDAVKESDTKTKEIVFGLYRENDFVVFSVSDSGAGVPESMRDLVFKPFYSTKGVIAHAVSESAQATSSGMGLGLYLAKNMAIEHGGDLTLNTEDSSKASEFLFKLPFFQ